MPIYANPNGFLQQVKKIPHVLKDNDYYKASSGIIQPENVM